MKLGEQSETEAIVVLVGSNPVSPTTIPQVIRLACEPPVAARAALAFSTIILPPPQSGWGVPRRRLNLQDRAERARAYEVVLREGSPSDLMDYIDGALLVDIWDDLDVPDEPCAE